MVDNDWQAIWQKVKNNPYEYPVLCLLALNGLSMAQIRRLSEASVDLTDGWLTTYDEATYPLTSYSMDALKALSSEDARFSEKAFEQACDTLAPLEAIAHRRLSGAIWIHDESLQMMLETTHSTETPLLPLRFTFPFSIVERLQPNETSDIARKARAVLQTSADWLIEATKLSEKGFIPRLLHILREGSLVFLIVSTGVNGLNLIHNVLMGRLLSPADYSQLTFIITLQLLIGLLPMAVQTVVARFTARYHAQNEAVSLQAIYDKAKKLSLRLGVLVMLGMLILSPVMVRVFQLDSLTLLLPLVVVVPFFVRMGVERGMLQGLGRSFWLSGAYLSEGVIRLGVGVLLGYALIHAGRSLEGAIWGVIQSIMATWFIGWLAMRHFSIHVPDENTPPKILDATNDEKMWLQMGWMTAFVLIGQALITNSDFLLVKNFFSPDDAGLYAAISVLGRIVYFGALPLTILLVPLVARRQALNESTRPILFLLIGGGVLVCGLLVVGASLFADTILGLLYGDAYLAASYLLAPYALAASLYTLTNLTITYQVALGQGGETWMPIAAGVAQITLILLFHESLNQVITIQILLMATLFGMVLWRVLRASSQTQTKELPAPIISRDVSNA